MTGDKKECRIYIHSKKKIYPERSDIYHCGDVSGEVPPVLIPNTVVKLTCAENTLLETAREDRLLLHPLERHSLKDECFFFLFCYLLQVGNNPFPIIKETHCGFLGFLNPQV